MLIILQSEAKKHGKQTIAHAAHAAAFARALEAKVDVVTHTPMDETLHASTLQTMLTQHVIAVPTLTMMENVPKLKRPGMSYAPAKETVTAMYKAGIPILAGTDSNAAPGVPAHVKHGESMHHELELLVDAGMSSLDALRAGTSLPAKYFDVGDRGIIAVGKRADLVLLKGDPIEDIKATRTIQRIWCKGIELNMH